MICHHLHHEFNPAKKIKSRLLGETCDCGKIIVFGFINLHRFESGNFVNRLIGAFCTRGGIRHL